MLDQFCEKYGFEPVFIPFQPINDAELLAEVMQHMRTKSYLALANLSVSDMLALFTRLDLVLSMRLHGLVFAAMANRPCLGLSYDPKISSFMRSIEQGYVEIAGQIDNKEILTRLDEIMQNQVPYKTSAETLKRKAELNFELLSQVL
jgi:polysaccharide pyruvyl transferase WcaK-like protein